MHHIISINDISLRFYFDSLIYGDEVFSLQWITVFVGSITKKSDLNCFIVNMSVLKVLVYGIARYGAILQKVRNYL